ncbi:MAG: APC family permease [Bacillota bacterium]|nr:APC family permease [Bacillota bacterium]
MGEVKKVTMSVGGLFVILFGSVCAGCFGMEDMVGQSGPGLTLLMILVVPCIWAVPIALSCAEMGATLPVQGGYYIWIKTALGPFWGYCAGFWRTWIWYLNEGILLVLSMEYVASFFNLSKIGYMIVVGIILGGVAYVNIVGVTAVKWVSVGFLVLIMVPFGLVCIFGLGHLNFNPIEPFFNPSNSNANNIAYAIVLGVWMYGAFEGPASYAGEVKDFQKIFPKALAVTVLAMTLTYFLPMLIGLSAVGQWEIWGLSGGDHAITAVELAKAVGGNALGMAMLISAMCSNIIQVNDNMAATVRIPAIISQDGLAPGFFQKLSKKHRTPVVSIVFTCVLAFALLLFNQISEAGFAALIEFQTFVFFATYIMLMVAMIALRIKQPDLERPYRVPLPTWGLICYAIPVILICFYCIIFCSHAAALGAVIFGLGAPISYFIFKKIYGGVDGPNAVEHYEFGDIDDSM